MRLQCLTRACWAYPQFTTPVLSSTVRAWLSPRQYVTDSSLKPPLVPGILSNLVKTLSEYCQTSPKHCPNTVIALSEYCQSTPRKSCTPSHVSPGRPQRVLSSHSRCVVKSSPRHSPSILQSCHRLVLALPPRPVRDYVLPSSSLSSSKRLQISLQTAPEAPRIPSSRSALVSLTLKAISSSSSIPSRLLHQFHLVSSFLSPFFNLHTSNPLFADSLLIAPPFVSISVGLYCPLCLLLGKHFSFSSFRDDLSALPLPLSFHFPSLLNLCVHFHIFLSRFLLFPSSSFFSFSSHPSPSPPRSPIILRFTFPLLSLLLRAFTMHLVLPFLVFSSHLVLLLLQFAFTSAAVRSSRLQRYAISYSNDMLFLPT